MTSRSPISLRRGSGASRVGTIELFYDLVYVFAVTQLSHYLVDHPTPGGAFQAAILLAGVWQIWVYTTWSVTYLDPERGFVRGMLIALMLGSLLVAAALPEAFGRHALLVAITYVVIQLGRAAATIFALRDDELRWVFVRVLPWSAVSGTLIIIGAESGVHAQEALWIVAVLLDLGGSAIGFWLPGLGGSSTRDWTVDGGHFAERCQAFVLIALGESVVVIGGLARLDDPALHDVVAFLLAFAGVVALWWVYFDRAAEDSVQVIAESDDPGRLARNAFHIVHPLIIGGIIATAAADELMLEDPEAHGHATLSWLTLGGVALFLVGHALFKWVVWRVVSWPRVGAVVALALLGLVAPHVSALTLGVCTTAVVLCVIIADRILHPVDALDLESDPVARISD